jgi:hypothetical protein
MALAVFAGRYNATNYAYGCNGVNVPALNLGSYSASGSGVSFNVQYGFTYTPDGRYFTPLNTNAPINIGDGSAVDTSVTPSTVTNNTPQSLNTCIIAVTTSNAHGVGEPISSATYGLQEAINAASALGGGLVVVDPAWTTLGGTSAMIAAATIPVGVAIEDLRSGNEGITIERAVSISATLAQLQTLNSVGISLAPASGAGTVNELVSCVVNLKYGSASFSGGGAVGVFWGLGGTQASSGTIASTVFTSLSANEYQALVGQTAAVASSVALNKALVLQAASADFTSGTGGSAVIQVVYRVHSGLA